MVIEQSSKITIELSFAKLLPLMLSRRCINNFGINSY